MREEDLYEHLTAHEDHEQEMLAEYQRAAEASGSAAFEYLAALIIDDERRHHRLLGERASALETDVECRSDPPAVPRLDHWGPDPAHVGKITVRSLEHERADAKELRRLAHELRDMSDTTMWPLLVQLMEIDTRLADSEDLRPYPVTAAWRRMAR